MFRALRVVLISFVVALHLQRVGAWRNFFADSGSDDTDGGQSIANGENALPGEFPFFTLLCLIEGDGSQDYDGVSELWFDSKDDFEAAYASEIGQEVANDSLSKVSKRVRYFIDEHQIK